MANIKGNKGKNFKGGQNKIRCNERIKAQEVRLISPEGNMIGVVPIEEALAEARKYGLDLIEISPNANPVVCRILDFGKYQYETSKKQKSSKSSTVKLKEVKFRFCTDTHDYETKLRHIIEFLSDGDKVKVQIFFRGREMEQTPRGFELIAKIIQDLAPYATNDSEAKLVGRNIITTFTPLKNLKQKQQANAQNKPQELKNTVL